MNKQVQELRELTEAELRAQLKDTHKELFLLRFRTATRQLANTAEIGKVRKKIARINTLLHQHEQGHNG
jgi:large subunit ribosomal protein L29